MVNLAMVGMARGVRKLSHSTDACTCTHNSVDLNARSISYDSFLSIICTWNRLQLLLAPLFS